jgi:hypothetical protein
MGQLIELPFYEEERIKIERMHEERILDRKSELCKREPFAVRALGTVIMIVCVPYYLLKAFRSA